jgi:ABC-2 type transport system ATP-binding protein
VIKISEIKLNNVNKIYENIHALKDLSLNVEKGQIFAYLGPNGAGKTTTIELLLGLIKPSSGEVKLLNANPYYDDEESIEVRRKIGVMLDSAILYFDLTGLENLIYWGELYGLDVKKANKIANENLKLLQLLEWKDKKVSEYSHGMRKRLAFARTIIHNPEILILDEPTNGIDFESREIIRDIIKKLSKKGKTIFFSSHDLEEVQKVCTNLAIINKGQLLFNGSLTDFELKYSKNRVFVILRDINKTEKFTKAIEESSHDIEVNGKIISFIPKNNTINLKSDDILSQWTEKISLEESYKNLITLNKKVSD